MIWDWCRWGGGGGLSKSMKASEAQMSNFHFVARSAWVLVSLGTSIVINRTMATLSIIAGWDGSAPALLVSLHIDYVY